MKRVTLLTSVLLVTVLLLASLAACKSTAAPTPTPVPAPASTPTATAKPAPATTTPAATASPAPAAKPTPTPTPAAAKPAGTLRVAMGGFGTELFGVDQSGSALQAVSGVYEFLINIDAKGQLAPMLADKWETSPDAKTWTYYLHKGVQFHGGNGEFTAEDVKFTVEQGGAKNSQNTAYTRWAPWLNSIEIVNPYQITFRFKEAYVPMAVEASSSPATAVMVSKKYYQSVGAEQAGRRPIGTGPFKFVEHQLGDTVTVEAMENHWRQTPAYKTVVYKLIPETNTMIAMLKTGEIDIASVQASRMDELKSAGFKFENSPASSAFYIGLGGQFPTRKTFDPTVPWVGNPSDSASVQKALKVRQALALGVDRAAILRNIFSGAGSLYAAPLFGEGAPWSDPKWKAIPYDPVKAKALLAEAGYPNGLPPFDLWTYVQRGREELPTVAQAVAMQWQQIGVKATIRNTDWASQKPKLIARDLTLAAFTEAVPLNSPEPYTIYNNYFYTASATYYGVEDSRLDAVQIKILGEPDNAKRAELQRQWGQLMVDNTWIISICHKDLVYAVGPKVAQWKPISVGQNIGNMEYAVPASDIGDFQLGAMAGFKNIRSRYDYDGILVDFTRCCWLADFGNAVRLSIP